MTLYTIVERASDEWFPLFLPPPPFLPPPLSELLDNPRDLWWSLLYFLRPQPQQYEVMLSPLWFISGHYGCQTIQKSGVKQ